MPSNLLAPHLSTGSGPRFHASHPRPTVTDEAWAKASPPASHEALSDRAVSEVFSDGKGGNTTGLIASSKEAGGRQKQENARRTFRKDHGGSPQRGHSATLRGNRTFPCFACGACCRNLNHSPLYADLDRGDGICHHLDIRTNLCRIYEARPKICRVTEMFEAFNDHLTWEEYVDLNLQSCHELHSITYTPEPAGRSNACLSNT